MDTYWGRRTGTTNIVLGFHVPCNNATRVNKSIGSTIRVAAHSHGGTIWRPVPLITPLFITSSETSPQFASSVPSRQSLSPSHKKPSGMQRVLSSQRWLQLWSAFKQSSSSERSWHWGVPSHTSFWSIHIFPWAHWNWPVIKNEDYW